jgi:hypothetical protein
MKISRFQWVLEYVIEFSNYGRRHYNIQGQLAVTLISEGCFTYLCGIFSLFFF